MSGSVGRQRTTRCTRVRSEGESREEAGRDLVWRFVVEGRRHVAVDAEGDGDRGMAETFLNDSWVDALFEGERRPGVAKAVQR